MIIQLIMSQNNSYNQIVAQLNEYERHLLQEMEQEQQITQNQYNDQYDHDYDDRTNVLDYDAEYEQWCYDY